MSPADLAISELPAHLMERCRVVQTRESMPDTGFVLYWMCSAIRTDENPALDVARLIAQQWNRPLLVYQALSETWKFASDRHHMMILQGARDVQRSMAELGISYAFHLERPGADGHHLTQLAGSASLVVTEDMPTDPARAFLSALQTQISTPIMAVDSACVVPMQRVGRAFERAFEFRSHTKEMYNARLTRSWPTIDARPIPFEISRLPFVPIDLQSANLPALIAECRIDHSVGPVIDTCGGMTAGYRRWNAFKATGLKLYARRRNNALIEGVSRMSAYLHHGMVSPMRIAREAADLRHEGAEKFLDELLIWRELAYAFCFYRPDHGQVSALPRWARDTLQRHSMDQRPALYSWEQLARGETDDALWNAAQKSLLIHGELHNNVRMTWGKALLQWTRTPERALELLCDLNHRYALDGRDPASYGGIFWCLGQFDRPFYPESPILGTLRPRPTHEHAQRLDTVAFQSKTEVSRIHPMPRTAVIGAGLSGSIAARTLSDHGLSVTLFEKSRGAGGRMATRDGYNLEFDHGAQAFEARDRNFRRFVRSWVEQKIAARWTGEVVRISGGKELTTTTTPRYVGSPQMNSLCRQLTADLTLITQTHISKVIRSGSNFLLLDTDGKEQGTFDRVIVATPAPQAAEMLKHFPELATPLSGITFESVWCVMLALSGSLDVKWSAAHVDQSPIAWIARNQTKPGRAASPGVEQLVIHSTAEWASQHLEEEPEHVAAQLLQELQQVTNIAGMPVLKLTAHRWKYSQPVTSAHTERHDTFEKRSFATIDHHVIACGDWTAEGTVEAAFLSGMSAAGQILCSLVEPSQNSEPSSISLESQL